MDRQTEIQTERKTELYLGSKWCVGVRERGIFIYIMIYVGVKDRSVCNVVCRNASNRERKLVSLHPARRWFYSD